MDEIKSEKKGVRFELLDDVLSSLTTRFKRGAKDSESAIDVNTKENFRKSDIEPEKIASEEKDQNEAEKQKDSSKERRKKMFNSKKSSHKEHNKKEESPASIDELSQKEEYKLPTGYLKNKRKHSKENASEKTKRSSSSSMDVYRYYEKERPSGINLKAFRGKEIELREEGVGLSVETNEVETKTKTLSGLRADQSVLNVSIVGSSENDIVSSGKDGKKVQNDNMANVATLYQSGQSSDKLKIEALRRAITSGLGSRKPVNRDLSSRLSKSSKVKEDIPKSVNKKRRISGNISFYTNNRNIFFRRRNNYKSNIPIQDKDWQDKSIVEKYLHRDQILLKVDSSESIIKGSDENLTCDDRINNSKIQGTEKDLPVSKNNKAKMQDSNPSTESVKKTSCYFIIYDGDGFCITVDDFKDKFLLHKTKKCSKVAPLDSQLSFNVKTKESVVQIAFKNGIDNLSLCTLCAEADK